MIIYFRELLMGIQDYLQALFTNHLLICTSTIAPWTSPRYLSHPAWRWWVWWAESDCLFAEGSSGNPSDFKFHHLTKPDSLQTWRGERVSLISPLHRPPYEKRAFLVVIWKKADRCGSSGNRSTENQWSWEGNWPQNNTEKRGSDRQRSKTGKF